MEAVRDHICLHVATAEGDGCTAWLDPAALDRGDRSPSKFHGCTLHENHDMPERTDPRTVSRGDRRRRIMAIVHVCKCGHSWSGPDPDVIYRDPATGNMRGYSFGTAALRGARPERNAS